MGGVSLTVTELTRLACPSGAEDGGSAPPRHVGGRIFHDLAHRFVELLLAPEHSAVSQSIDLWRFLYTRLASAELDRLIQDGSLDAAASLTEALQNFCDRLAALRDTRRADWSEIFFAQEMRVQEADFGGVTVRGRVDALRFGPDQTVEIIDYKLSLGRSLDREAVQLAIYAAMLRENHPLFRFAGCLEYFLPHFQAQPISEEELKSIFEAKVVPVLQRLIRGEEKPSSPAESVRQNPADLPTRPAPSGVLLGVSRSTPARDVFLERAALTRHVAVLGGTGSGKTSLALNIIEQLLGEGIPVLMVDRKGDLSRYAAPEAWISDEEDRREEMQQLRGKIVAQIFTPGHPSGNPLGWDLVRCESSDAEENRIAIESATGAVAAMLNYRPTSARQIAVLQRTLELLAAQKGREGVTLASALELLRHRSAEVEASVGMLDAKLVGKLAQDLQTLEILHGKLLEPSAVRPRAERLLGTGSVGPTPLTIISTKFLGSEHLIQFWMTRLFLDLLAFASRHPSNKLQACVFLDEADLYLPASSKPPTKAPLEGLLKRARSAGIGIILGTQSPGDLDYKSRENILTWCLGRIQQQAALKKLEPLFQGDGLDPGRELPKQSVGQFVIVQESSIERITGRRNFIPTEQLSERRILELAARSRSLASEG